MTHTALSTQVPAGVRANLSGEVNYLITRIEIEEANIAASNATIKDLKAMLVPLDKGSKAKNMTEKGKSFNVSSRRNLDGHAITRALLEDNHPVLFNRATKRVPDNSAIKSDPSPVIKSLLADDNVWSESQVITLFR